MSTPTPTPVRHRAFLRYLPLLVMGLVTGSFFLSGCPSSGGSQLDFSNGDRGTANLGGAPSAHQLRQVEGSGRVIELRFEEAFSPESAGQFVNYIASGGQVLLQVELLGDDDRLRLHFDEPLIPGLHTLCVTGVERASEGQFPAVKTLGLESDDLRLPRALSVTLEAVPGIDNDCLEIVFDDDMWEDDVLDLSHVQLEVPVGQPLALDPAQASYDSLLRKLKVNLPGVGDSFDLAYGDDWTLRLSGMRDLAGNQLAAGTTLSGSVTGDESPPRVLSATQNSAVDPAGIVVDLMLDECLDESLSLQAANFQFTHGGSVVQMEWFAEDEILRLTLDAPPTVGVDSVQILNLVDPAGNQQDGPSTVSVLGNDGYEPLLVEVLGQTESGHFNDSVVFRFNERLHPGDAVNPDYFTLESPVGSPVDLSSATLTWDEGAMVTTITFGGDYLWNDPLQVNGRLLQIADGEAKGDRFGQSVTGLEDINGDGYSDFAVGARDYNPPGLNHAGAVYLFSGSTGELLLRVDGHAKNNRFGHALASMGDYNLDGVGDFLVGAPDADPDDVNKAGSVYICSGSDGGILLQIDGSEVNQGYGEYIANAGDVNRDTIPDVMIGLPSLKANGLNDAGIVRVYSGADASLLYEWSGEQVQARAGKAMAGGGDFNQDGYADPVFGAADADPNGLNASGSVYVYSGIDGTLLYRLDGLDKDDNLGNAIALTGDLDGDQIADLAIAAFHEGNGSMSKAGAVYVHSGVDGSLLATIQGQAKKDYFGNSVSAGQDFDGDGTPDLLIGASGVDATGDHGDGALYIYSGATFQRLHTILSTDGDRELGENSVWAGDFDRDGHADMLTGFERADTTIDDDTGAVQIHSGFAVFPYESAGEYFAFSNGASLRATVEDVRDLASNVIAPSERTVLISGDSQAPACNSMVQNLWVDASGATVDLHFNEAIDLDLGPGATFTSSTGELLAEQWLIDRGTTLRLRFNGPLTPGVSYVSLTDVSDVAGNLLALWSDHAVSATTLAPQLTAYSLGIDEADNPSLILSFQGPLLAYDATDPARFLMTIDGSSYSLEGSDFDYDPVTNQVLIHLDTALTPGQSYGLVVEGLRDPYGNSVDALFANGIVIQN